MKKIRYVTLLMVVYLVLATVLGWNIVWKVLVVTLAVYDLVLIALKFLRK
jgi:hypothetical protein